ncbi:MAG: redoxin family protein [Saprospiraceae bacterium]|nr:redoxin family protein [Saprospiraceae bacterium]MBK8484171.1 redoxin family protein [Saprospiraceae bacterium]MBK9221575.1 redoxin family protein [Saprospiraceae bacterium]MBK9721487.1 redoxin family protein [Saprospiraceae bacterium]MBK9728552.1 redoxin family protein [Saprospiraceae bacterium]
MVLYSDVIQNMITNDGNSVFDQSNKSDVLLVFLRHFGCTFCREALEELSTLQNEGKFQNTQLILVHMSNEEIAAKYFERYHLNHVLRVADPDCKFYKQFGLLKGTFNQLFGFRSWFRGIEAGLIKGYGFGMQLGDGFQMPGVFLISNGKILSSFIHKYASDKPNYLKMVSCLSVQ